MSVKKTRKNKEEEKIEKGKGVHTNIPLLNTMRHHKRHNTKQHARPEPSNNLICKGLPWYALAVLKRWKQDNPEEFEEACEKKEDDDGKGGGCCYYVADEGADGDGDAKGEEMDSGTNGRVNVHGLRALGELNTEDGYRNADKEGDAVWLCEDTS